MVEDKTNKKSKYKTEVVGLVVVLIILVVVMIILGVTNVLLPAVSDRSDVEKLVKQCLDLNDDSEQTVASCLEEKAFFYLDEGDCNKALMVYDFIPTERYDDYSLADRYNEAYSLSLSCDDTAKQEYWKKKFEELSNKLEARD